MVVNVPLGSIYNTHSMVLYDARISNGLNFSYDNVLKVKENETHARHFLPKFSDMLTLSQSKADYAQPLALPHLKKIVITPLKWRVFGLYLLPMKVLLNDNVSAYSE